MSLNLPALFTAFALFLSANVSFGDSPDGHPCNPPPKKGEIIANPIDIDTAKFMEMMKRLADGLAYIPGKPISYKAGKGVKIKIEVKGKEICCNGVIKTVNKYKGNARVDVGSISGNGPVPGLYWPGIGGFTLNLSLSLGSDFALTSEYPSCDEDSDACGALSVVANGEGGITALIVDPDIISVSGKIKINVKASSEYCLNEGLKNPYACATIKADVTGKMMWTTFTICESKPIFNNC